MKELDQKLEELRKVNETFETYQQAILSDLTEETPDYQTEVDIAIEFEKIHRVLLNNVLEWQQLHLAYIGVHHFEIELWEAEEMSNSGDESVTSVMTELVETYQKLRVTLSSTAASLCKNLIDKGKDLRKRLFTMKNSVDTSFSSSHSVSSRSPERKGRRVKLPTIELPHLASTSTAHSVAS